MYVALWQDGQWYTPNGHQTLPTQTAPAHVVGMVTNSPWNNWEIVKPKAQTAPGRVCLRVKLT